MQVLKCYVLLVLQHWQQHKTKAKVLNIFSTLANSMILISLGYTIKKYGRRRGGGSENFSAFTCNIFQLVLIPPTFQFSQYTYVLRHILLPSPYEVL